MSMNSKTFYCIVDFDSSQTDQPEGIIRSAIQRVIDRSDATVNSIDVEKSDMVNEYTEQITTQATVRLSMSGLQVGADTDSNTKRWIETRLNAAVPTGVHGIRIIER
ncbi:hypothetical protein [Haloquadratum walsbyi]|jgi:hypothetical protein|uniref:Uncharacterized protein n=1 Tax=Haloquadratum walsbyi J07HQW2 TaxID=1238425 RepID=U1PXD3_9EURY|nr:hypothetical protein [Haloquadratum walsbyi]ERG97116.1 MAG: hypothetical protein J07HQW2_03602 [Haloquadratum walsbyi J07HQW2]